MLGPKVGEGMRIIIIIIIIIVDDTCNQIDRVRLLRLEFVYGAADYAHSKLKKKNMVKHGM